METTRTLRLLGRWTLAAAIAGCGGSSPSSMGAAAAVVDEPAVMAMASRYATLAKINRVAFTSIAGQVPHASDPVVDVYVNSAGVDVYRSVDPLSTSAIGPFSPGTLVVKRNQGTPPFLTVMYKGPAGYDATHADWWYGRLNDDGSSTGYTGRVSFCIDCHGVRASQDYAYGVSLDNR